MMKLRVFRKAKIVATIGPASCKPHMLLALLRAGMDVARLNLSFGKHSEHAQVIRDLRRLSALQIQGIFSRAYRGEIPDFYKANALMDRVLRRGDQQTGE